MFQNVISGFYTKKAPKVHIWIFALKMANYVKASILVSEIEARNHLPVSKSRSNKICQVLQQNCERLIMVA